jgi:hypothetical protein
MGARNYIAYPIPDNMSGAHMKSLIMVQDIIGAWVRFPTLLNQAVVVVA